MNCTILVVDDDPKITALLRRALTFEGYGVNVANDGLEALKLAWSNPPDLVVLDLMMPVLDGMEVCRRLRAESDLPILLLTAKDEISDRVQGLDAGADDYLVKPFALEELLARVRALLRRGKGSKRELGTAAGDRAHPTVHSAVYRFADLRLDTGTREACRGDRIIQLTTKEYELLSLFLEHPRQVLTRELIMDRIWGFDYSGESNVLEVYVGMLRQKLEEGDEKRLIHTVRGAGYVLRE